jgi:hypothetical protein
MKYITRVDYVARVPKHTGRGKREQKRTYWQVRIGRGHREEAPMRKQFFDGAYGGKEKALLAAKKWRNQALRRGSSRS